MGKEIKGRFYSQGLRVFRPVSSSSDLDFFFINLFLNFYLFIFGCTVSSSLCEGFL